MPLVGWHIITTPSHKFFNAVITSCATIFFSFIPRRINVGVTKNEGSMSEFTIDGKTYHLSEVTPEAQAQYANMEYVNELIIQKNNELQVALTAQIGYRRALKRELEKIK